MRLLEVAANVDCYTCVSFVEQTDVILQVDIGIVIRISFVKDAGVDVLSAKVDTISWNDG